jgi:hypothetical protein
MQHKKKGQCKVMYMITAIDLALINSYGKESKVVNFHISWIVVYVDGKESKVVNFHISWIVVYAVDYRNKCGK